MLHTNATVYTAVCKLHFVWKPLPIATWSKGRYTLSVKLSGFTVWRHTWRKPE